VKTDELILHLASKPARTRRLAPPWRRSALWLAVSAVYVALVIFVRPDGFSGAGISDPRFVIEQIATLATAVTAAIAAFCSIVPGYDRRWLLLPFAPLLIWLAALGEGCVHDWLDWGSTGLQVHNDWACLPVAATVGAVPALTILLMLRRGAPLVPHVSLALGAIAVGAVTNFALRLFHYGDATIMVLVWHVGVAAVFALAASLLGSQILKWPQAPK
jgi:hypothetical protein